MKKLKNWVVPRLQRRAVRLRRLRLSRWNKLELLVKVKLFIGQNLEPLNFALSFFSLRLIRLVLRRGLPLAEIFPPKADPSLAEIFQSFNLV